MSQVVNSQWNEVWAGYTQLETKDLRRHMETKHPEVVAK